MAPMKHSPADERKLAQLINAITEHAIFFLDPEGNIELANSGAVRIFEVLPPGITGSFSDFCAVKEDAKRRIDDMLLKEALKQGTAEHFGYRRTPAGQMFWAHTQVTPIYEDEVHCGYSVILRNLSERRLAEAKYKNLLDTAPDAMVIVDERGQINLVNSQTEAMFGYSRIELLGKPVEILIPDKTRDNDLFPGGSPLNRQAGLSGLELYARRKDGSLFPVEITSNPINTDHDLLVSSSIRDISSRIKIGRELKEAHNEVNLMQKWLQGIIDGSKDFIAALDPEFKLIAFNKAYYDFFKTHFGVEVHAGAALEDLTADLPEDFAYLLERWREALSGQEFEFEHNISTSTRRFTFKFSYNSIYDTAGKLIGASHIVRDVTSEKENETLIRLNEARLKEAQQFARMGSFEMDIESGKSYWSEAMYEIFGVDGTHKIGWEGFDILALPEHKEALTNSFTNALLTRQPFRHEYQVKRPSDGAIIDIYGFGNIITGADGKERLIGIIQDITDRKAIENELSAALSKSEEAAKLKQEFLANMSHEIRTPLNVIIGFTRLLVQSEELSAENRDYAQTIFSSSEDLLVIINDILDFSKMEDGQLCLENSHFSLRSKLNTLEKLFSLKVGEKDISLKFITAEDVPDIVVADPARLTQLLSNLLGNAVKFTEQGSVEVYTHLLSKTEQDCRIQFVIKDTGIGFSEDKAEAIFQSFMQAEGNSSRKFGGTGLGLAIVKNLLQLMDGKIDVDSKVGEGSRFSVTLNFPIGDRKHMHLENPFEPAEQPEKVNISVLLAEDNRNNQVLAKKVLAGFGFSVDIANNGREAVDKLLENHYDIILMDIQMPVMDGVQAVRTIRGLECEKRSIPIIALTAHALKEEREKYLASGMNAHINKPFNPTELYHTVLGLLKQYTPAVADNSPLCADLSTLREMVDHDEELINEMLMIFCQDVPRYIEAIREARASNNWVLISQVAHTLKSSLTFTGRQDLVELADKMQYQHTKPVTPSTDDILRHFIKEVMFVVEQFRTEMEVRIK